MNAKRLNDAWLEYNRNHRDSMRFGQYMRNNHNVEYQNSFYMTDDNEVYTLLLSRLK